MKKLLSMILVLAMTLTFITIPVSAATTDSFAGDYVAGDNILLSFDASNQEDVATLRTSTGSAIETAKYGDKEFVYAQTSSTDYVDIPLRVDLSTTESTYVKMLVHPTAGSAKNTYLYTVSGTRRAHHTIADSEFGSNGLISADVNCPPVEVIYELKASDSDSSSNVYTVYMRPVDSDGVWYMGKTNEAYGNRNGTVGIHIYNGLAVSSVVVYRKQAPELAAVNGAVDSAAMKNALSTYATQFGVDFTKLNAVENDEAVYEKMLGKVYTSVDEVVSAFNAAVEAQISAEFDGDYVKGDKISASFSVSQQSDLDQVNKDLNGNQIDSKEWDTFTTEEGTFIHPKNTSETIYLPLCPGWSENGNIYIKFRARAMTDDSSNGGFHFYFANTHRLRNWLTEDVYKAADPSLTFNTSGPAMDNVYVVSNTGAWSLYAKQAGSNGNWVKVISGQTAAHTGNKYWSLHGTLAVGDIKVYTKQAAELAAVNSATTAFEMKNALSTYATQFGVDFTKLNAVENDDAVYEAMLGKVYTSVDEVVSAFNAAVEAQISAEFDGEYVIGDINAGSFDPSNQSDLDKVNLDLNGNQIDSKEWDTFTNEEGTFLHAKEGTIYLPMCPGFSNSDENLYIRFAVRAMTNDSSQGGFHFYFANTHRLRNWLTEDVYKAADSSLTFNTSSPAMDNIYEITPSGAWTLYAKHVGSEGNWVRIATGQTEAHTSYKYWSLHSSLAVGKISVYRKQPKTTLTKVGTTADKWTFEVATEAASASAAYKVYVCGYDVNGDMLAVSIEPFNTEGSTTLEMTIPTTGSVEYFRAFIWDQALTPLINAVYLEN